MSTTLRLCVAVCGVVWLAAAVRHAPAADRPDVHVSADRVGEYEKIELTIPLGDQHHNPYDPAEVDVAVELQTPSGKTVEVPAFYFQPFEWRRLGEGRRSEDWFYATGSAVWKARFAPMEVGDYTAVVTVKDRTGTARSDEARFRCVPSKHAGFLRASRRDPRFLETSEGKPFFSIGQNLAFVGVQQYVSVSKAEEIFARLEENGANYLRIWTCCQDWALAIEARKSAWGRSWAWKPPLVSMPGDPDRKCVRLSSEDRPAVDVSPSHRVALRPNTRYVASGRVRTEGKPGVQLQVASLDEQVVSPGQGETWTDFRREFETGDRERWLGRMGLRLVGGGTAWIDGLSLREAGGGPELLWEADPNRPRRGVYNQIDCFMLDKIVEAAEKHGVRLQLCYITRDLYMNDLKDPQSAEYRQAIEDARKLTRYAVARWGYSTSVAVWEYWNEMDPGRPTDAFYTALGEHLQQIDPYRHLRSTSTWHPSPRDMRHPKLGLASVHFYLRPASRKQFADEVEAAVAQAALLREHAPAKPALIDEFGLATDDWRPSPDMRGDRDLVHFHNALWASALSGTSGTAMFWWWDQLDRMDCYGHYRPLARFLADVPWTTADLHKTTAAASADAVRIVGLQGPRHAYLWLFDPNAAWTRLGTGGPEPKPVAGTTVQLTGLQPGRYQVRWWHTREGKTITEKTDTTTDGTLKLAAPTFTRDVACAIVPAQSRP